MIDPAKAKAGAKGAEDAPLTPEKLYTENTDYVWTTLQRLGVSGAELEDLSHEVFITAMRRLHTYDRSRPLRPWLFGISVHIVKRHQRWWRRRREVGEETGEIALVADPSHSPEVAAGLRQNRALFLKALQQVKLERRALLVAHEIDGTPIPQIAQQLGIPVATAYSRLRLGRAELVNATRGILGGDT